MAGRDDAILVGVVARSHGNRGEVILNSETDFPEERFQAGVHVEGRVRTDGKSRWKSKRCECTRVALSFASWVTNRSAMPRAWRGWN